MSLISNQWVHLSVSIDQTTNSISFFENGNHVYTKTESFNLDSIIKNNLIVGKSVIDNTYLPAKIDDIQVHDYKSYDTNITIYDSFREPSTIPLNEWTHLVTNYDHSQKHLEFYINGNNIGKFVDFNGTISNNDQPIVIGENFTGELSDVIVVERPLFDTEVLELSSSNIKNYKTETLFEYTFQDTNTSQITNKDSSVHGIASIVPEYSVGSSRGSKALVFDGNQSVNTTINNSYDLNNLILEAHIQGNDGKIVSKDNAFSLEVVNSNINLIVNKTENSDENIYSEYFVENIQTTNYTPFTSLFDIDSSTKETISKSAKFICEFSIKNGSLTNGLRIGFWNKDDIYRYPYKNGLNLNIQLNFNTTVNQWHFNHHLLYTNNTDNPTTEESTQSLVWIFNESITSTEWNNALTNGDKHHLEFTYNFETNIVTSKIIHIPTNTVFMERLNISLTQPMALRDYVNSYNIANFDYNLYNQTVSILTDKKQYSSDIQISPDNFTHVGLDMHLYDGVTSKIDFYKNGVLSKSIEDTNASLIINNDANILICDGFTGKLDEIKMEVGYRKNVVFDKVSILEYLGTDVVLHIDFMKDKTQWSDESSYGHTFTTNTMGTSTINGKPSGLTNNGPQYISIESIKKNITNYEFSCAIVVEITNAAANSFFWWQWRDGWSIEHTAFQIAGTIEGRIITTPDTSWRVAGKKLILLAKNTLTTKTYTIYDLETGDIITTISGIVDEATITYLQNSESSNSTTFNIGSGHSSAEGAYSKYGELMFVNRHFTDNEEVAVVSYLRNRWASTEPKVINVYDNVSTLFNIQEKYNTVKEIGNYSFDESSGIIVLDKSMYKNNGVIVNNPIRKLGTYDINSIGLVFDASQNQYVQIPGALYDNINFDMLTFATWVKVSNDGTTKIILKKENSFEWIIKGDGKLQIVKYDTITPIVHESTQVLVTNAQWTHLTVTIDNFNESITFYQNGVQKESLSVVVEFPKTTSDLYIGSNFTGEIDNVHIYEGILDNDSITKLSVVPDILYTPTVIEQNTWSHIAAVYNKNTNMVCIYKDGEYNGCYEDYLQDFSQVGKNNNNMFVATLGDNVTFFDGQLDDIRIYNKSMTKDEIAELHSMYVQHKPLISGTITPSLSDTLVTVGNVTLREPPNMIANKTFTYYSFATLKSKLNGVLEVKSFIKNISALDTTAYKTFTLTTTGSENTSTVWNVGTLDKLVTEGITTTDMSKTNQAYVYVVGKSYDDDVFYVKEYVRNNVGTKTVIGDIVYNPFDDYFFVDFSLFNNTYSITAYYIAAFDMNISSTSDETIYNLLINNKSACYYEEQTNLVKETLYEKKIIGPITKAFTDINGTNVDITDKDYTIAICVVDSNDGILVTKTSYVTSNTVSNVRTGGITLNSSISPTISVTLTGSTLSETTYYVFGTVNTNLTVYQAESLALNNSFITPESTTLAINQNKTLSAFGVSQMLNIDNLTLVNASSPNKYTIWVYAHDENGNKDISFYTFNDASNVKINCETSISTQDGSLEVNYSVHSVNRNIVETYVFVVSKISTPISTTDLLTFARDNITPVSKTFEVNNIYSESVNITNYYDEFVEKSDQVNLEFNVLFVTVDSDGLIYICDKNNNEITSDYTFSYLQDIDMRNISGQTGNFTTYVDKIVPNGVGGTFWVKYTFDDDIILADKTQYAYRINLQSGLNARIEMLLGDDNISNPNTSSGSIFIGQTGFGDHGSYTSKPQGPTGTFINVGVNASKRTQHTSENRSNQYYLLTVSTRMIDDTTSAYFNQEIKDIKVEIFTSSNYTASSLVCWNWASLIGNATGTDLDTIIAKLHRNQLTFTIRQLLDHRDYRQTYIMDLRRIYLIADITASISSEVSVSSTIYGSYSADTTYYIGVSVEELSTNDVKTLWPTTYTAGTVTQGQGSYIVETTLNQVLYNNGVTSPNNINGLNVYVLLQNAVLGDNIVSMKITNSEPRIISNITNSMEVEMGMATELLVNVSLFHSIKNISKYHIQVFSEMFSSTTTNNDILNFIKSNTSPIYKDGNSLQVFDKNVIHTKTETVTTVYDTNFTVKSFMELMGHEMRTFVVVVDENNIDYLFYSIQGINYMSIYSNTPIEVGTKSLYTTDVLQTNTHSFNTVNIDDFHIAIMYTTNDYQIVVSIVEIETGTVKDSKVLTTIASNSHPILSIDVITQNRIGCIVSSTTEDTLYTIDYKESVFTATQYSVDLSLLNNSISNGNLRSEHFTIHSLGTRSFLQYFAVIGRPSKNKYGYHGYNLYVYTYTLFHIGTKLNVINVPNQHIYAQFVYQQDAVGFGDAEVLGMGNNIYGVAINYGYRTQQNSINSYKHTDVVRIIVTFDGSTSQYVASFETNTKLSITRNASNVNHNYYQTMRDGGGIVNTGDTLVSFASAGSPNIAYNLATFYMSVFNYKHATDNMFELLTETRNDFPELQQGYHYYLSDIRASFVDGNNNVIQIQYNNASLNTNDIVLSKYTLDGTHTSYTVPNTARTNLNHARSDIAGVMHPNKTLLTLIYFDDITDASSLIFHTVDTTIF